MEHEDPLTEHEDPRAPAKVHEDELDARLLALFRRIESPAPSVGFAARTMKAVVREPLPANRRPLRSPFTSLMAWAALIAGVAIFAWAMAVDRLPLASVLALLVSATVQVGIQLVQFAGAAFALVDLLATAGLAVSRAAVTREGSIGLMLVATVGALSLSALHRLLMSEEPERGISQ